MWVELRLEPSLSSPHRDVSLSDRELPPVCASRESLLFAHFHSPLVPLQVLLPAASLLQLMDVRKNCCDFLQSQLHPTNCLGIRAFADVHACTELLQQANAYAGEGRAGVWVCSPPCLQLQQLGGFSMSWLVSSDFWY